METFGTRKRLIPPRGHYQPLAAHFRLGVWRELAGIHSEISQCGST